MWRKGILIGSHAGFALVCSFLWWQAAAQDENFEVFIQRAVDLEHSSQETVAITLMHAIHEYGRRFGDEWVCGLYAVSLGRSLQLVGIDVRILQMKAREIWGLHIVVEARVAGRWVVLDPFYDLAFRRKDGELVEVADLKRDWGAFASQVPADYDPAYRYADYRYTNWEGLPLSLVRPIAEKVFGKEAVSTFSLRAHVLNHFRGRALACTAGWIVWVIISLRLLHRPRA